MEFDYIVVGAGTAGCVLAARLSEDADRTVCLVEAGGKDSSPFIGVPGAVGIVLSNKAINWGFQSVPQPHLDGRRIPVPRGRVLGGSFAINGMVYSRGHPSDYDGWAAAGAQGWSYREVLPYFRKSEHNESYPDSPFHGHDGPMNVRTVTRPNPLNIAFMESLRGLGFKACEDFSGADTEGYGLRHLTIRNGRRETTARVFLRPALHRRNLTVMTSAQVTRVLLEGRRAVGIELFTPRGGRTLRARTAVVLSAGAIQSPQLLMLSGIGDGEHLMQLGIEVRHHLPGVGRNLHDHLASPVHMVTEHPDSYGISWRAMPRNVLHTLEYLLMRSGPLASNVFESVAFLKSTDGLTRPDIQLVFQPAKKLKPGFPFPLGHGYAVSPVALYPRSRGRLTLTTADPLSAPAIDANLLGVPEDIEPLIRAVRLIRRAFASPPFAKYAATESAPGPSVQTDAEIAAYIRATSYTVHHPAGTCRMGSDPDAVLDPELRVRGIDGLRVADASVMPMLIGGNTNAPVIMIAEKAADMIRGKPPLPPVMP
jgi:choline dehydrogenase